VLQLTLSWPEVFALQSAVCLLCKCRHGGAVQYATAMIIMSETEYYSGWIQLCVRAQPCMQGSGDAAYLLCMLCCLYLQYAGTFLSSAAGCTCGLVCGSFSLRELWLWQPMDFRTLFNCRIWRSRCVHGQMWYLDCACSCRGTSKECCSVQSETWYSRTST
jgi:hypothetical protein